MHQFLSAQSMESEEALNNTEPKLATLLFFNFFSSVDQMSGLDAFRYLKVQPKSVKVSDAEFSIDPNGKTFIKFEIRVSYTQKIGT